MKLLLRAHSEQRWLSREVIPVLRQIETREKLPEEQLPAALAYLEVIWAEATVLARESDAALRALDATHAPSGQPLPAKARRYHASVKALREAVLGRVVVLIAPPEDCPGLAAGDSAAPNPAAYPASTAKSAASR